MEIIRTFVEYHTGIIAGLQTTLKLSIIIWTLGLLTGTALGVAENYWRESIGIYARSLSFVLSGLPPLVLLFWLHYPLQGILNVNIDPFITAAGALSLINTFLVADIVNDALLDFPEQYITAAKVCGLSPRTTFLKIQLPLILRSTIPRLLLVQVSMLQGTIFASLISVDEIFRVAQRINAQIYRPVEVYTALGFLFLMICLPLNGLALWMKHQFTRNISEK
ncbi:ABC transporter permease subunit [Nodularia spumigena]|jgi:polar amino acid transport system permease protein|uniref:ABC transporter permease subunit n=1 Tax=Nodularia spumigena UHCC 0060 TaxID=3110300 RepID=A0ABU5UR09_NODSP|nr:ABC transporter permease subunit [Nodularia spumigena]MEA5524534.1 ABC transporter permease subunit [Nodularia spumigena UHCC 0143]MEA5608706.1 ABC transporter permease subunit [Nodularia spumigena UHCC 0060]MEA5614011.1 ABC transporter permease subunit [Nodularia spumigena UHCC 0040]